MKNPKLFSMVFYSPHYISAIVDYSKYNIYHADQLNTVFQEKKPTVGKKILVYAFDANDVERLMKHAGINTILLFATPEISKSCKSKILDAKFNGTWNRVKLNGNILARL